MKCLKIIPLLLGCMLLCGCLMEPSVSPNLSIRFANKTNDTVYVSELICPNDTTVICTSDFFENDWLRQTVAPGDSCEFRAFSSTMINYNRRLQVIVLKRSTMQNHTQEELIENNIFDKRYILYYKDLISQKFHISYVDD